MGERKYNKYEWTPCPSDCAYCCDPFYGHSRPHPTQERLGEYKTVRKIEGESTPDKSLEDLTEEIN